jgi:hypothetical protein
MRFRRGLPFLAWLCLGYPQLADAHPVAFQGSTGIMGSYSKMMTDFEVNYSIRHWIAPSLQLMRFSPQRNGFDIWLANLNLLAYRRNGEDYQANLYLHGGGGESRLFGNRRGVYHAGFTADIEDRRLYFLTSWNVLRSSQGMEVLWWKARAGFAPYLVGFDGLHSWFIVEVSRKSHGGGTIQVAPILRFFYQNVLWEVGSTLGGEVKLNHIIHF